MVVIDLRLSGRFFIHGGDSLFILCYEVMRAQKKHIL